MKKHIASLILLTALTTGASALDLADLFWATCNTSALLDTRNDQCITAFDANMSFLILNGGLSWKNIHSANATKLTVYTGVGFGSFVQLQAGFPAGATMRTGKFNFSIRNRYDWQIGYAGGIGGIAGNITLSPAVERYFNNPHMKWYIGLGIGFSINCAYGITGGFRFL